MAETLGSLVDKLSIKNLRIWYLDEMIEAAGKSDPKLPELKAKRDLVKRQSKELEEEINGFLELALQGKVKIRDEKLKLYTNLNVKQSDAIDGLGKAIHELTLRNLRLWHLEDEVRRTDITDSQVAACKRKIDASNQERNDLIDKVDEILELKTRKKK